MTKATVDRAELKHALGILTRIAPAKSKIPVLTQVKLAVNGHVQLSATDYDVAAVVTLARQGRGGEFQALLPAKTLSEYVRKSTAETLTFVSDKGNSTDIEGIASIIGLPVEDFPATLGEDGTLVATLPAAEVAAALRDVQYAISREVVRYALTGVLLETKKNGRAAFVASDGKRLAAAQLKGKVSRETRFIIPWKGAELLERLAQGAPEATVEVRAHFVKATDAATGVQSDSETIQQLHFVVGDAGLYARPVEGHFPDWELVVPSNNHKRFTVGKKDLIAKLERVRQACTDKTLATRFSFGGGTVTLFSKTPDVGEASAELPAVGPETINVVFNPEYVLDFLKALPKSVEQVTISLKEKTGPGLFNGVKGHDYVLMPLTINL